MPPPRHQPRPVRKPFRPVLQPLDQPFPPRPQVRRRRQVPRLVRVLGEVEQLLAPGLAVPDVLRPPVRDEVPGCFRTVFPARVLPVQASPASSATPRARTASGSDPSPTPEPPAQPRPGSSASRPAGPPAHRARHAWDSSEMAAPAPAAAPAPPPRTATTYETAGGRPASRRGPTRTPPACRPAVACRSCTAAAG